METLVGRLTKNATVATTKSDKQVVNFSVAVNEYYKPKNGEAKKITRYFNCAYWRSTRVADILTKGALVEINGRIGVNTYQNMEGKTVASLTMQVNILQVHGQAGAKDNRNNNVAAPATATTANEANDDLPF